MVLAFVLQILFQKYYLYIPSLHCNGIMEYLGYLVGVGGWGGVDWGRIGGGGGSVRSLRLKNWLPLESTIIYMYKVVRS